MMSAAPFMKSSWRSLRQISKWSSPAPATIHSFVSWSVIHWTMGSERDKRFIPSTSLWSNEGSLVVTATRTTGDTENIMGFIG